MNPELIRIATENKAILDTLKAQMAAQNAAVANTSSSTKISGIVWKIMLFAGIGIVGYNMILYKLKKEDKKLKSLQ